MKFKRKIKGISQAASVVALLVSATGSLHASTVAYEATHCEVFVDKALVNHGYHGAFGYDSSVNVYVKLDVASLENHYGEIKGNVRFEGTEYRKGMQGEDISSKAVSYELKPYFNSPDYWELHVRRLESVKWSAIGFHDWEYQVLKGNFLVETEEGVTLVAQPKGDHAFTLDFNLLKDIDGTGSWKGTRRYGSGERFSAIKLGEVSKTADITANGVGEYLNPYGCR